MSMGYEDSCDWSCLPTCAYIVLERIGGGEFYMMKFETIDERLEDIYEYFDKKKPIKHKIKDQDKCVSLIKYYGSQKNCANALKIFQLHRKENSDSIGLIEKKLPEPDNLKEEVTLVDLTEVESQRLERHFSESFEALNSKLEEVSQTVRDIVTEIHRILSRIEKIECNQSSKNTFSDTSGNQISAQSIFNSIEQYLSDLIQSKMNCRGFNFAEKRKRKIEDEEVSSKKQMITANGNTQQTRSPHQLTSEQVEGTQIHHDNDNETSPTQPECTNDEDPHQSPSRSSSGSRSRSASGSRSGSSSGSSSGSRSRSASSSSSDN
ncbi:uncharacterized protein LOC128391786 [Panonychus citri]|uniref:uncharacterized protein LOC128391786 n=1 Tax=Panonychus citri TaxID=50023 RepID=UPI00230703F6|nr:uncharacterized protein LOC128391786 [Panonychus citri]